MRTSIPWNTDQFGTLIGPPFHDGTLVGFQFSDEQFFRFQIRTLSNYTVSIELLGIAEFNIDELCNRAIISDIYIWNISKVPEEWDNPESAWNTLFGKRYGIEGAQKLARRSIQKNPQALLVQIECSDEGGMAAVCDEVEIFHESSDLSSM